MNVIASLIMQLILGVLTQGPDALRKLIDIFAQSSILTADQADQFRTQLDEAFASARWQTDAAGGAPTQPPQAGGAEAGS